MSNSYIDILNDAISEAKRFIEKAEAAKRESVERGYGMHSAAAKRASMDLTRALVEVRGRRRY